MNPYEVLGIARNAKDETIKKAFRALARKWHPDLFHTPEEINIAEQKMKELNAALDLIGTPEKRAAYESQNPITVNVYEHYANKKTSRKSQAHNSSDIENEKQRQAVLQFLNIEFEHKNEIFDMFAELATGAFNDAFSEEEYLEMLELVLQEQQDCIAKINEIIAVAKKKQIKGLDSNFAQAHEVIEELTQKGKEIPKSLKQAHYVEETRLLTEKIHNLMNGFRDRILAICKFNLLEKTWEFDNDTQLNSFRAKHKSEIIQLLKDMMWVQKNSQERNIEIALIALGDISSRYTYNRDEKTLDECREIIKKKQQISSLSLQQLREKFWEKKCTYSKNSKGETIFTGTQSSWEAENYKGNFICPPNINQIARDAFYWLKNLHSITIPAHLIKTNTKIELHSNLKKVTIAFDTHSQTVNVSRIQSSPLTTLVITLQGSYICISPKYYGRTFALVNPKRIYMYDEKKICQLNGVRTIEQLIELSKLWDSVSDWENYQLTIHTWAQVVKRLPDPTIMQLLPVSIDSAREWVNIDKTNLSKVLLANSNDLKPRIIRLYIALGALNGEYCHLQAEWLISQLDISKMYRSRLERFPQEMRNTQDPMFSVPKSLVDFVEKNIGNKEFSLYVFAFLEGYKLFQSEAKRLGVELSPEFVISTAPQYIFHRKAYKAKDFAKKLLESERNINVYIADKILELYTFAQNRIKCGANKNIIETKDIDDSSLLHYRYFNLNSLESYLTFEKEFLEKHQHSRLRNSFYRVESENVFLSDNSHAIEIIDSENNRVAIVILNLFDKGELFADIMSCENKSIDVIETIKRAIIDQKNCNSAVTSISIGMGEAARAVRHNTWRQILENSDIPWAKQVHWIKFEYLFENRSFGIFYKGYRARFMVEGHGQYFNSPHPYIDSNRRRRSNRRRYW